MSALGWILAIVGTLGGAGTIALAVFAPALAAQLLKGALKILEAIVSTRIGCAALAFLAGAVIFELHGDQAGAARVQTDWDAAKLEYAQQLDQLNRKADTHAREINDRARADEERATRDQQEHLAAYTAALPRSSDRCAPLTDRDLAAARRLQNNAGRRDGHAKDRDQRRLQ